MSRATLGQGQRDILWQRSDGYCDWCGRSMRRPEMHAHHRKLRSRGGTWALSNIVALHPECHNEVHGHPAQATHRGFMVGSWADPAAVMVEYADRTLYFLHDDGTHNRAAIEF